MPPVDLKKDPSVQLLTPGSNFFFFTLFNNNFYNKKNSFETAVSSRLPHLKQLCTVR